MLPNQAHGKDHEQLQRAMPPAFWQHETADEAQGAIQPLGEESDYPIVPHDPQKRIPQKPAL